MEFYLHELWSKTLHAAYFLVSQSHLPYNSSLNISLGPSWQSPTASLAQSSDINAYKQIPVEGLRQRLLSHPHTLYSGCG